MTSQVARFVVFLVVAIISMVLAAPMSAGYDDAEEPLVRLAPGSRCPLPPVVEGAGCQGDECPADYQPREIKFDIGDTVGFQCRDGYETIGESEITCQEDGTWTASPICLKTPSCGKLPEFNNGACQADEEDMDDYKVDVTATCICDENFLLLKPRHASISCQKSGDWSSIPICQKKSGRTCSQLVTIQHGKCESSDEDEYEKYIFEQGEALTCTCDDGYVIKGDHQVACQLNGRWSLKPKCVPAIDCVDLPRIPNGYCTESDQDGDETNTCPDGQSLNCFCYDGYFNPHPQFSTVSCSSGTWISPLPTCNNIPA